MVHFVTLSHPESIKEVQGPNYKFLGLSLSSTSLVAPLLKQNETCQEKNRAHNRLEMLQRQHIDIDDAKQNLVRLVGDPNVNYPRNTKWWRIEWTQFHFVLIFGLGSFFLFWTILLLRQAVQTQQT